MKKTVAAFSLPLPLEGLAEINELIHRVYGTGETMMTADGDTIRITAPADGFGPLKAGRRKASTTRAEDARLAALDIRDGRTVVTFDDAQGTMLNILAVTHRWFDMVGGTNYVEQRFTDPTDGDALYAFIVQKADGLTPHDARIAAEQRADIAEARVAELEAELSALTLTQGEQA